MKEINADDLGKILISLSLIIEKYNLIVFLVFILRP